MPLCRECGGQFSSEARFCPPLWCPSRRRRTPAGRNDSRTEPASILARVSAQACHSDRTSNHRHYLSPGLICRLSHAVRQHSRPSGRLAYQASRLPIYRLSRQRSIELPNKPDPVSYCFGRPYNGAGRNTIDYSRGSRRHSSHNNRGGARQRR